MLTAFSLLQTLAASRLNPVWVNLVLPLGIGLLIGGFAMFAIHRNAKKKGEAMNGAFWQKLMLYGVFGLVAGYFSMRITIKKHPELYGNKPPLSSKQLKAISENPVPKMPQPKLTNPFASQARPAPVTRTEEEERELRRQADQRRDEHQARVQAQREESQRRAQQVREEHERRAQKMKQEREARRSQQQAAREEAMAAEEARKRKDLDFLNGLNVEELEAVRDQRMVEKEEATAQLRASNAKDSGATPEERRAASQRFSAAVGAYMTASKTLMQKRREQRELKR